MKEIARPGHVYCHRCGGSSCEHSLPPSCRHVFTGYSPTGLPRWEDFARLCLLLKHPEVDRLYEQPPAFLTMVQRSRELHGVMLDAFRSGPHMLMGQVAAGFYSVPARAEEGRGVLALTLQAVAGDGASSGTRLGLNVLGLTPAGEELTMLWERQDDLSWRRSVRWAQSALERCARRAHADDRLQLIVDRIMHGLARRLAREHRARSRRTRHAEARHLSGRRPTRKALADLRSADDASFMVDEKSGALVVLGGRGRTHFFTPEGRLVSSVRYRRDEIGRKSKYGKWRVATTEEREGLRALLARS
jgi:hypothetical protein